MLVALVILGIAAVAILAGLQLSVKASDIHRKQTLGGAYVRGYAEAIEKYLDTHRQLREVRRRQRLQPRRRGLHRPGRAQRRSRRPPQPLAGDGSVAGGACPGADQGVQRLRLSVSSDGRPGHRDAHHRGAPLLRDGDGMRLSARLRALRRRDDGFTLPELIITVAIIGIIAAG